MTRAARGAVRALLQWTATKEGLLGATLSVSPRSEHEEARSHVARWSGSESTPARRLPARRGGWAVGGDGGALGCRRAWGPGPPVWPPPRGRPGPGGGTGGGSGPP